MAGLFPDYLTQADLEEVADNATVVQLFDKDGDGLLQNADLTKMQSTMASAEGLALSHLLIGFTADEVANLAAEDPYFVQQVAWVAMEMGTETRRQFISEDGKGRYWAQYERAVEYFKALSKTRQKARGAARSKQTGGAIKPRRSDGGRPRFVFAPDPEAPQGRGGF